MSSLMRLFLILMFVSLGVGFSLANAHEPVEIDGIFYYKVPMKMLDGTVEWMEVETTLPGQWLRCRELPKDRAACVVYLNGQITEWKL